MGTMGNVPTGLPAVAAVAKVAVMASPFLSPEIVPVKAGFGSPYSRLVFVAVTDSSAGVTVNVPLFRVTL